MIGTVLPHTSGPWGSGRKARRFAGLLRDQRIPLTAVRKVYVVPDGLEAARGLRAHSLAPPRLREVGIPSGPVAPRNRRI